MKKIQKLSIAATVIIASLVFGLTVTSCQKEEVNASDETVTLKSTLASEAMGQNTNCVLNPVSSLSSAEIEMLKYMREEEKLARDVYTTLYAQYNMQVFNNIAASEQVHMDRVLCLMDYYSIPDPASLQTGVFSDTTLQNLYNALIQQGSSSLVAALTVGATIEDLDIVDLEHHMAMTTNTDILRIFKNLQCGSGNHLRAFSRLLVKRGSPYTPQYLTQQEYNDIINGTFADCRSN